MPQPLVIQHLDIVHRTGRTGMIAESVMFPSAEQLLTSYGREHTAPTLLLRLVDGSVWMFKSAGHAWTERRISKAAILALANINEAVDRDGIQKKFSNCLAMPSLIVMDTMSAHAIPEQSEIRKSAYTASGRQKAVYAEEDGAVSSALARTLKKFLASLDAQVMLYAFNGTELDIQLYNYLVHQTHGHYRMQFAEMFPLLLTDIVKRKPWSEEKFQVRRAIDAGLPLLRVLSDVWRVRPRTVRYLIGKTLSTVGECWVGNIKGLACILDSLPQEFLPNNDLWQWSQFNRAVEVAQDLSHEAPWKSAATLAWLRECAPYWLCASPDGLTPMTQSRELVNSILRLQKSLEHVLTLEIEDRTAILPPDMDSWVGQVVDDLVMSSLRKGWLPQMVARFERKVGQTMANENLEFRFLMGRTTWPLFPREFKSSDGLRSVATLTDAQSFHVHARKLNICVSRPYYIERCRRGKSFVLAFFDTESGEPQSTADISLVRHSSERDWSLQVAQHTGANNIAVSDICARALAEVLNYCNNIEVRRHIDRGLQLISDIDREGVDWGRRQASLIQYAPALRAAIGNSAYESAIQKVCAKASL